MIKELQQLKATGTNTKNSRFGSAICSPGDINKDGALGKYNNLFVELSQMSRGFTLSTTFTDWFPLKNIAV